MPKFKYTSPGVGFLDNRFVNLTGDTMTGILNIGTKDSATMLRVFTEDGSTSEAIFTPSPSDGFGFIIGSYGMDVVSVDAEGDFSAWDGDLYMNYWSSGDVLLAEGGGDMYLNGGGGDIYLDGAGDVIFVDGRWDSVGNVGIGTDSPGARLDVVYKATGVTTDNIKIFTAHTTVASFDTTSAALTSHGGYITNTSTRSAGANDLTNVALYLSASGGQNNYGLIVDGTIAPATDSASDLGASDPLYFANAYIDKIYLNATATLDGATAGEIHIVGSVGIGTTAPVQILHIESASTPTLQIDNTNYAVGVSGVLKFAHGSSDYSAQIRSYLPGANDIDLHFYTTNNTTLSAAPVVNITGDTHVGIGVGLTEPVAKLEVVAEAATTIGLIVKAAASQTANIFEARLSSNAITSFLDAVGGWVINETGSSVDSRFESANKTHMLFLDASADSILINSSADLSSTFGVVATAAADIGVVVRGAASQSANLQEWQDSNAAVLAVVDASGNIGIGLTPTANMAGLSVEAGLLTIKETTAPTADTNYGKLWTNTSDELWFQDGAGANHLLHGDAFSEIWHHSGSASEAAGGLLTISAEDAFTLVNNFSVVGHEDDSGNVVGSASTNNLTLSARGGGEYEISYHASLTATGASKEIMSCVGVTLATPKDITNVTDDTVSPIVITSTAHGFENGDMVEIAGVLVNTAANGSFIVANKTANTFEITTLDGSATTGNGDFDEGSPTGDITIWYLGNMVARRDVSQTALGSISATGLHILQHSDVVCLYIANLDDTNNINIYAVSLDAIRIGD